ncbi:MAG: cytochrome c [Chloroflexi bacterium]|nr:cytochrome c [Chloroflexota bacterium]
MRLRHAIIVLAMVVMVAPLLGMLFGIGTGPAPFAVAATSPGLPIGGSAARGQQLYVSQCIGCHAKEAGIAPPHNTTSFRTQYPTDESIAVVVRSGRHPMPSFMPTDLNDQSLADIIQYLKSLP